MAEPSAPSSNTAKNVADVDATRPDASAVVGSSAPSNKTDVDATRPDASAVVGSSAPSAEPSAPSSNTAKNVDDVDATRPTPVVVGSAGGARGAEVPGRSGEQWRLRLMKPSTVDAAITACNLSQVDAQCLLMEDDTDIFPAGWVPRRHPTMCGCPPSYSPPSAQCITTSSTPRFVPSPVPVDAMLSSKTPAVIETATSLSSSLSSSKKSRKIRSEPARRGVIRTMQDCFKKVKRFVDVDNAGALLLLVCDLIGFSDVKTILYYRRGEDTRTVQVFNSVEGVDRETSNSVFNLAQITPIPICAGSCGQERGAETQTPIESGADGEKGALLTLCFFLLDVC